MKDDKKRRNWREPHRLVLIREDTLAEVASYRLSLLNVYLAASAIILVLLVIIVSVVFYTPVRHLVPGYADVYQSREYRELLGQVDRLEDEMSAQRLYLDRFRGLLTGLPGGDTLMSDAQPATPPPPRTGPRTDHRVTAQASPRPVLPPVTEIGAVSQVNFLYAVPPVRGIVSASFDPQQGHYGVDILAPAHTPVVAILDGIVITADWTLETGNTIGIQHAGNTVSFYKHNSRNLKRLGSLVKAGEAVAIIGNTGELTTGPHLHFELWIDGKPIDPERVINF